MAPGQDRSPLPQDLDGKAPVAWEDTLQAQRVRIRVRVLNTDEKQQRTPQDRGREDHVLAADRVFSRNLIKLKSSQKFAFQGRLMNSF